MKQTKSNHEVKYQSKISFTIFSILFSILIISLLTFINMRVSAATTTSSANASVNVSSACTMTGAPSSGGNTYTGTITPGTSQEFGPTTLTATCNDPSGLGIYAIGYSGDSYTASSHTQLISTLNSSYNINTNTPSSAGSNSYWSMKLVSVAGTYPATITNSYDNYNVVPNNFTKVAYRSTQTDIGEGANGTSVNASYQVGISSSQVADTYTGKVKYTLVHPNNFTIGTYNINYLANGGTGTMSSQTNLNNFEDQTLSALSTGTITPPTGYNFAGWCTVQDTTTEPQTTCNTPGATSYPDAGTIIASTVSAEGSGSFITPGTLNLYAYYSLASYDITLDGNGATTPGSTSATATYNSSSLTSITNPQKVYNISGFTLGTNASGASVTYPTTGACLSASNCKYTYSFDGWYNTSSSSGGTQIITSSGALTANNGYTDSNSRWTSTSTPTVYARWNNGAAITLPSITKTGYNCGWSTNSTATTYTYQSGYTGLVPASNMTLYGICVIKSNLSLKVSFDSNVQSVAVRQGSTTGTLVGTVITSGNSVSNLVYNANYYLIPIYKSGYEFSSWTKDSGTAGTLSSTTFATPYYQIGDGSNGVTLASKSSSIDYCTTNGVADANCMQKMTSSNCTTTAKTATDSRDGETYLVQNLSDNKCWLLDNLRLDLTNSTTLNNLTTSNTHVDDASLTSLKSGNRSSGGRYATAGFSGSNWTSGYNNSRPMINVSGVFNGNPYTKDTTVTSYGFGSGKIGVYYNYCAASAGNYCYDMYAGTGNAEYDICPTGWKIPDTDEYRALNIAYNNNAASFRVALATPLSGNFFNDSANGQGTFGYFWLSTYYNDNTMNYFRVYSSSMSLANLNRWSGNSVRCVLNNS